MKNKANGLLILAAILISNSAWATTFHSENETPASCVKLLDGNIVKVRARYKIKDSDTLTPAQVKESEMNTSLNCHQYTAAEVLKSVKPAPVTAVVPVIPAAVVPVPAVATAPSVSDQQTKTPAPASDDLAPIVVTAAKVAN